MGTLFDIRLVWEYFPKIISGLHITLLIVACSMVAGLALGMLIALVRIYRVPVLNLLATIYLSFIRNTPIIIQLFIVYFGLPAYLQKLGIDINNWSKLSFILVTYALNNSAFMAEIIRSALLSVSVGQSEAAYSVGLTRWQMLKRIVIPQAFATAFPTFGTRTIGLLESTSLAFTLGVLDMMGQVDAIGVRTYHTMEGYVVVAVIFVLLSLVMERGFKSMEQRLSVQRRGIE